MPNGSTIINDFLEIPKFSQGNLKILRFVDTTKILRCGVVEGDRERVKDNRSMKSRFRNANLVITHVLDSCVKLAVLHKSLRGS